MPPFVRVVAPELMLSPLAAVRVTVPAVDVAWTVVPAPTVTSP